MELNLEGFWIQRLKVSIIILNFLVILIKVISFGCWRFFTFVISKVDFCWRRDPFSATRGPWLNCSWNYKLLSTRK